MALKLIINWKTIVVGSSLVVGGLIRTVTRRFLKRKNSSIEEMENRKREVGAREQQVGAREREVDTREQQVGVREREVDTREQQVEAREREVDTMHLVDARPELDQRFSTHVAVQDSVFAPPKSFLVGSSMDFGIIPIVAGMSTFWYAHNQLMKLFMPKPPTLSDPITMVREQEQERKSEIEAPSLPGSDPITTILEEEWKEEDQKRLTLSDPDPITTILEEEWKEEPLDFPPPLASFSMFDLDPDSAIVPKPEYNYLIDSPIIFKWGTQRSICSPENVNHFKGYHRFRSLPRLNPNEDFLNDDQLRIAVKNWLHAAQGHWANSWQFCQEHYGDFNFETFNSHLSARYRDLSKMPPKRAMFINYCCGIVNEYIDPAFYQLCPKDKAKVRRLINSKLAHPNKIIELFTEDQLENFKI